VKIEPCKSEAKRMEENPTIEPTERSIPPVSITKVIPIAKMTNVPVCGIDGQKEAYEEILKGGQYKSTVVNNPTVETEIAVNLLIDFLQSGKEPEEKDIITGTILVTSDNVKEFYDPNSVF